MGYIVLYSIDPDRDRRRYYALTWGPTLFGEWAVERVWGRMGTERRQRAVHFAETRQEALALVARHLRRRMRHGYWVVAGSRGGAEVRKLAGSPASGSHQMRRKCSSADCLYRRGIYAR